LPKPFSFGEVTLDVTAGRERSPGASAPETPFHILVLGDFSGRANRGRDETDARIANRRAVLVDRDNFEEVMARLGATIRLPLGEPLFSLRFAESR
jgi:predicted component of type VI protein secretion system